MAGDNAIEERQKFLVFQQRVPEGYSATQREHRWHSPDDPEIVSTEVTGLGPGEMFATADKLMDDNCTKRNDYAYRVVLETVVTTRRVVLSHD